MFETFTHRRIDTSEAVINLRHAGSGPPVLLLHGHPQTHAMWHKVAPRLAETYSVVCADLRGYGDSSKPPTAEDHAPYSKRAMARDMVEAHAGARLRAFRRGRPRSRRTLRLSHGARPSRAHRALSVLDIIPTAEHFQRTDMAFAMGYWHWFFLAQPHPNPRAPDRPDPDVFYLRRGRALFDEEALSEYRRCYTDPATIHAMCEDYRAGATIDMRSTKRTEGRAADRLPGAGTVGRSGASIDGTTCRPSGVTGPTASRATASIAATTSPRRRRKKRLAALEPFLARALGDETRYSLSRLGEGRGEGGLVPDEVLKKTYCSGDDSVGLVKRPDPNPCLSHPGEGIPNGEKTSKTA